MTNGSKKEEFFTATKLVAVTKPSVVKGFVIMSLGHKDDIPDVNILTIADAREIADMLYAAATLAEAMQLEALPLGDGFGTAARPGGGDGYGSG